jgi:Tol biopolymer transport system component/DNA-binding winged helix-turn-helix (wHTH) protein
VNTAPAPPHRIRFGAFEVNLKAGELRTDGVRIRLQEKPFQILELLLEQPGEVIARQEIQRRLWSEDTFVDFEHSINTAVMRLREALGDSAGHPRYIETVGRRGYRLIAPVTPLTPSPSPQGKREKSVEAIEPSPLGRGWPRELGTGEGAVAPVSSPAVSPEKALPIDAGAVRHQVQSLPVTVREPALRRSWRTASLAAALVLVCAIVASYWLTRPLPPPRVTRVVQLTNNGRQKSGRLLTDGPRLFFSDYVGGRAILVQIPTGGGETVPVPYSLPGQFLETMDISANQSELLVHTLPAASGVEVPLWTLPVLGGVPRRVGDVLVNSGQNASWSPDGRTITYTKERELWFINSDGSGARKVLLANGWPSVPRWSPDGKHLRFTMQAAHSEGEAIWELDGDGNNLHQLLPDWGNPETECCGVWSADGRYFLFQATRENEVSLWAMREKTDLSPKAGYQPVRLTSGPVRFESVAMSGDGKRLFAFGVHDRIELMRYDPQRHQFAPYMGGISASEVDFSKDGKWACYTAYPETTLWRSKVDGGQKLQLTFPPMRIMLPRWSPDGKRIVFSGQKPGKPWKNYLIPADGGTPQQLDYDERGEGDPQWSPDGKRIVFGRYWIASAAEPEEARALHFVDLATRQVSKLHNSEGVYSPRWSPDGRYIIAMDARMQKLILFDLPTGERRELIKFQGGYGFPSWSRDGTSILVWAGPKGNDDGIYWVGLRDRKVRRVLSVEELEGTLGPMRMWGFGLAPDGSILMTRDHTMTEVYALDWQAP